MKAERLITIMMCLEQEKRMTARDLAKRLEVSERTVYRDIDALCRAGIPIRADFGVGGGFSLPANYRAGLHELGTKEIQALFLHVSTRPLRELGIGQGFDTALWKLRSALTERNQQEVTWIQDRVYLDHEAWSKSKAGTRYLPTLQAAIWRDTRVLITYEPRTGGTLTASIAPYGLIAKAGMWFVAAEHNHQVRAFRLARIQEVQATNTHFVRPEDFHLQVFWDEWSQRHESIRSQYRVKLRVAKELFATLRRECDEMTVEVPGEHRADSVSNTFEVSMTFESMNSAKARILGWGADVQVISPVELRDSIRSCVEAVLRSYARSAGENS